MCAIVVSMASMAQIKFEANLADALKKAKAENKHVMLIASTTWCGPCKAMEANVYGTAEAGEYFNKNFCVVKYHLDKDDSDKIAATYGVRAYPTFIFTDAEGKEINRTIGGARDAADFIKVVQDCVKPENTYAGREERLKKDPNYISEHIKFLTSIYKNKEAGELVQKLYASRTIAENFSKDNLNFYKGFINSFESPLLKSIVNDQKEGAKIMGKDAFAQAMKSIGTQVVFNNGYFNKPEVLKQQIEYINNNKQFQSGLTSFVADAVDAMVAKDGAKCLAAATKNVKEMTVEEISMVAWFLGRSFGANIDKDAFKQFIQAGIDKSKEDPKQAGRLQQMLQSIK